MEHGNTKTQKRLAALVLLIALAFGAGMVEPGGYREARAHLEQRG